MPSSLVCISSPFPGSFPGASAPTSLRFTPHWMGGPAPRHPPPTVALSPAHLPHSVTWNSLGFDAPVDSALTYPQGRGVLDGLDQMLSRYDKFVRPGEQSDTAGDDFEGPYTPEIVFDDLEGHYAPEIVIDDFEEFHQLKIPDLVSIVDTNGALTSEAPDIGVECRNTRHDGSSCTNRVTDCNVCITCNFEIHSEIDQYNQVDDPAWHRNNRVGRDHDD